MEDALEDVSQDNGEPPCLVVDALRGLGASLQRISEAVGTRNEFEFPLAEREGPPSRTLGDCYQLSQVRSACTQPADSMVLLWTLSRDDRRTLRSP